METRMVLVMTDQTYNVDFDGVIVQTAVSLNIFSLALQARHTLHRFLLIERLQFSNVSLQLRNSHLCM